MKQDGGDGEQLRALRAALPDDRLYHGSSWLEGGVARAVEATGRPATDVVALLSRMQRWSWRTGVLSLVDATLQLVNLELLRRRHGGRPEVVELPEPGAGDALSPGDLLGLVAQWEALGFGLAMQADGESEEEAALREAVLFVLTMHLARVDGVPARWDRLDPTELALELSGHAASDLGPPPPGFTSFVLGSTSAIYQRLAEAGTVDPGTADRLTRALGALALAFGEPSRAA